MIHHIVGFLFQNYSFHKNAYIPTYLCFFFICISLSWVYLISTDKYILLNISKENVLFSPSWFLTLFNNNLLFFSYLREDLVYAYLPDLFSFDGYNIQYKVLYNPPFTSRVNSFHKAVWEKEEKKITLSNLLLFSNTNCNFIVKPILITVIILQAIKT